MLNAKGRRCDVCARSPLLFFIFILSDVLARFKVIVMNYFGYQVELYKHIRKKQIFLIKIMFLHSKIALQNTPLSLIIKSFIYYYKYNIPISIYSPLNSRSYLWNAISKSLRLLLATFISYPFIFIVPFL